MNTDGRKRLGRFIKQSSPVFSKVTMSDFSFEDIGRAASINMDNQKGTLILAATHDEEELAKCVTAPPRFDNDLIPADMRRPVLRPIDFTSEWEKQSQMHKHRTNRHDDEESDHFNEQEEQREAEEDAAMAAAQKTQAPLRPESTKAPAGAPHGTAAGHNAGAGVPFGTDGRSQYQTLDAVGQDILSVARRTHDPLTEAVARPIRILDSQKTEAATAGATPGSSSGGTTSAEGAQPDGFIPIGEHPRDVRNAEADAAMLYKERLERERQFNEELAKAKEEAVEAAKAEGYRDGYRMGEEKAELQARQHAQELFGKVAELLQEFSGLKHTILSNVQENFYELCQAMAESLIKREFTIHPDTFVAVVRRAITESVEPGKFRVKVHPDTYERVASLDDRQILEHLVKDKEIAPGDFKIESELSVVDVNVSKLIRELLQKADANLFDTEDKAG